MRRDRIWIHVPAATVAKARRLAREIHGGDLGLLVGELVQKASAAGGAHREHEGEDRRAAREAVGDWERANGRITDEELAAARARYLA